MSTGRIPENILEDILSRLDLAELIAGYIPLKRAGRNFRALCPFHHEKTPSFMVSPERQIYHCFGCNTGGNAFNFLMQYERMEFMEAVEALAKKVGVVLPEKHKQDPHTISLATQLYKINELAAVFYENNLNSSEGATAKDYLLKRNLNSQALKLFKLGVASVKWEELINHLRQKNINLSLLEKAGLILSKQGGGYYDRFRNRIIFPIFDIKSRVLGFGARVLDNTLPKYINSPETPIYTKGKHLYGLNFAYEAIREADFAVIVEGYLDCIMPYQAGIKNIVASLGTALSAEQIRLIKRYTHNVVIIYDADDAGQMATLRTLDLFIEEGMSVKVVSLPQGFDPDLFVRKNGIEKFKEKIQEAKNIFDYKLSMLKSRYNFKEIEAKAKIASEMLPTINKFKNAVLRSEYIKQLAEELNLEEEALLQELKKVKPDKQYPDLDAALDRKLPSINPTEKLLLKLILEETALISRIRGRLTPADFQDERASRILSIMLELVEQGKNIEPSNLINYLDDDSISQVICESALTPRIPCEDKEKIVQDCIQRLKKGKARLKKERLHEEIKIAQQSGDPDKVNRLVEEFQLLIKEK